MAADSSGQLYVIRVHDGTHNIYRYDPVNSAMENLTDFSEGEQIFIMQSDPQGRYLYFDMAVNHGRISYRLNTEGGNIEPLIFDIQYDNRTPFVTGDGKTLYYASDRTGIFNIYRRDLTGEAPESELVTNVRGAAMYPAVHPRSDTLVYSQFRNAQFILQQTGHGSTHSQSIRGSTGLQLSHGDANPHRGHPAPVRDYEFQFSNLSFMPFLQYDYDAMKAGLIFYQNEMLDKMNLFAMADINLRGDYDINARLDFNQFLPRFYAEVYAVGLFRTDSHSLQRLLDHGTEGAVFAERAVPGNALHVARETLFRTFRHDGKLHFQYQGGIQRSLSGAGEIRTRHVLQGPARGIPLPGRLYATPLAEQYFPHPGRAYQRGRAGLRSQRVH
ncbi:MAG: hypothetical protein U5N26_08935 [Candidatus Marinimicrobia bacterium]|nr:hypothetical protein [Candidatus Neomarinimicrobiota bacterium]